MNDNDKLEALRTCLQAIATGEKCKTTITMGSGPRVPASNDVSGPRCRGAMKLTRELLVEYFGYDERSHDDWISGK